MENTSFQFPESIVEDLAEIARKRHTTVKQLLAQAVATQVFLDQLPPGTIFLVRTPDGKYHEVVRPEIAEKIA